MSSPEPSPDTPQGASADPQTTAPQDQAQAAATQQSQIRSLATALTPTDQVDYAHVMKGTLTAFDTSTLPPMCSIQLAGDTSVTIANVRYLDSYSPVVGDTVLIVKQGSELFVLGQMTENKTSAQSGWQSVTLTTTWNSNTGLQPVLYRKVFDNGSWKIQLQGRVWRNGSNTGTTLWTMPSGFIPGVQRAVTATRENLNNGSNVVQLQANTDGTITISGQTISTTTTSTQHGNLTTSYYNVDHLHDQGGGVYGSATKYTFGGGVYFNGVLGGAAGDGGNSANHRHTTDSATHTHDVNTTFPGWVSLDGIEYFL